MTLQNFPERVNLYPVMAIQAARKCSHVGGGYRLYVLAKALDAKGLGMVPREDVRAYAIHFGISPRQWERWIIEARVNDLLIDVQKASGEWYFILPSAGRAGVALGLHDIGSRKVSMEARHLIGTGWKARIWAAYEATFNGKPVTRERMQKIVNVPASTQRLRDVQAGVKRVANYVKLKAKADALPMLKEYGRHKGLYVRRDGFVGSRKPDSRTTDIALLGGKGRTRRANAAIRREHSQRSLSIERQALGAEIASTPPNEYVRLFNFTPDQRKATERKLARSDRRAPDIFEYSHTSTAGARVWSEC